MMNTQLYELAQIHEQEYMLAATTRRGGYRRSNRLIAGVTRRIRRRSGELAELTYAAGSDTAPRPAPLPALLTRPRLRRSARGRIRAWPQWRARH